MFTINCKLIINCSGCFSHLGQVLLEQVVGLHGVRAEGFGPQHGGIGAVDHIVLDLDPVDRGRFSSRERDAIRGVPGGLRIEEQAVVRKATSCSSNRAV